MAKTWEQIFELVEDVYGVYTDEEEGFFYCPECDEPIYSCDWNEVKDFSTCPICGFNFATGEPGEIDDEEKDAYFWGEDEEEEDFE